MRYWFKNINEIFTDFKKYALNYEDKDKRRIFIDRESDILFVAHLDTVQKPKIGKHKKNRICGRGFDDRLGCHIAHKLAGEYEVDLLLCDNEEIGRSTAFYQDCKNYNFIVEFDRAGDDVVTYEKDCEEFRESLLKYWKMGFGSFSDVSFLQTDCCCVNIGIGYHHAHSKNSHVNTAQLYDQLNKFDNWFKENRSIAYKQDDNYSDNWDEPDYSDIFEIACDGCGEMTDYNTAFFFGDYILCKNCEQMTFKQNGIAVK